MTLETTLGGEIDPDVGRWFHPTRHRGSFGVTQSVVARAWNGTWQLVDTSAWSDGHGRLQCTTARQDRYICQMLVRRHHSTAQALQMDVQQASGQRIGDQTVRNRLHDNGLTADDQHLVPFSPGNTAELDLTLPRSMNMGSCVTGVPFSSQTSPDSTSLLVTDVGGYGGGLPNGMLTSTLPNTTDTVEGP